MRAGDLGVIQATEFFILIVSILRFENRLSRVYKNNVKISSLAVSHFKSELQPVWKSTLLFHLFCKRYGI